MDFQPKPLEPFYTLGHEWASNVMFWDFLVTCNVEKGDSGFSIKTTPQI